jgi:hypothetical protein
MLYSVLVGNLLEIRGWDCVHHTVNNYMKKIHGFGGVARQFV